MDEFSIQLDLCGCNENKGEIIDCINMVVFCKIYLFLINLFCLIIDVFGMGNIVEMIEKEDFMFDLDLELGVVDIIIDLDVFEYYEYFKDKRKSLSEGVFLNDILYLEWRKNNNVIVVEMDFVFDEQSR